MSITFMRHLFELSGRRIFLGWIVNITFHFNRGSFTMEENGMYG